jgi:hypothetical protein
VTGSVRLRDCSDPTAHPSYRPENTPANSFIKNNFPLSLTRRLICAQLPAILMKTRNFEGEGGGGYLRPCVPLWEVRFDYQRTAGYDEIWIFQML